MSKPLVTINPDAIRLSKKANRRKRRQLHKETTQSKHTYTTTTKPLDVATCAKWQHTYLCGKKHKSIAKSKELTYLERNTRNQYQPLLVYPH